MSKKDFISFNDGILDICKVTNSAGNGDAVCEKLILYNSYRFKRKTTGFSRYFAAMQFDIKISAVLLIPVIDRNISTQDIAVISGKKYRIEQIQTIADTKPKHTQLTLSELEESYEFAEIP